MPFLMMADHVVILVVGSRDTGNRRHEPGAALAGRLKRHGIDAAVLGVAARRQNVGTVILEQARGVGADMIVMGAYGHMRVIEMVFGGATRTVLADMTLPVLMSH
jgi:nucleotide-binding universal stress UspA family protein